VLLMIAETMSPLIPSESSFCIPGVRSLIALAAGVLRMPRCRYVVLTLIGSTVWNAALITAG
jgi:membrane protein DedA with SNARE-associated domain